MKKLMAFILVVMLLSTMVVGCAKSQAPVNTPESEKQDQTESKTDNIDNSDNDNEKDISGTITYLTSQPLYAKNSDSINS